MILLWNPQRKGGETFYLKLSGSDESDTVLTEDEKLSLRQSQWSNYEDFVVAKNVPLQS